MKRLIFYFFVNLASLMLFFSSPSCAQGSLIETALEFRESIVTVNALLAPQGIASPKAQAAIDAKTGRIVVASKVKAAQVGKQGAGVIIHPSGLIVTNIHTLYNTQKIAVTLFNGRTFGASIVHMLPKHDLALIKINAPLPLKAIEFADSNQIHLGDEIINIGHSELLKETISGGRIIGIGTSHLTENGPETIEMIKINMNLYKGDSGGPVLDKQGRLVGMIVAKQLHADKVTYAIPSNKIKKLYLDFIR